MSKNNIIGFEQPAEFYYNSALKYMDEFNYIDALPYLRKAAEKEPDNAEYATALAEALTEMGRFDESNCILLDVLKKDAGDGEPFFGMGCNFIGLGDMERAGDCFEQYISFGEDGEFYYDAVEFLRFIEEYQEDEEPLLYDVAGDGFQETRRDAPDETEEGAEYTEVDITDSDLHFMKNNMALALYYEGRFEEAVSVAEELYRKEPTNIHAICNLILFSAERHDLGRMTDLLAKLEKIETDEPDDIFKKAVTYCDIGLHERAYETFLEYLKFKPYDTDILFMTGIAAANSGRYGESVDQLKKCVKIDPDDFSASYYLSEVRKIMETDGDVPEFGYSRQLPDEEAEKRLNYINDCFDGSREDVMALWEDDPKFRDYLIWGLYHCDSEYKLAVASVIADFGDVRGERILKKYILDPAQPDEVKDQIFIMLKKMGSAEPYRAFLGGNIVEISVSEAETGDHADGNEDE